MPHVLLPLYLSLSLFAVAAGAHRATPRAHMRGPARSPHGWLQEGTRDGGAHVPVDDVGYGYARIVLI